MRALRTRRVNLIGDAPPRHTHSRRRPWSNLGLRARVTVTFGLGALALSATMAGITYFTARQFILRERETAILRQAYVNASLARSSLRSVNPNIFQLLASLDTVPGSRSVLEHKGQWYATSISVGENAIPVAMRVLVVSGTPATQHFVLGNTPQMAVGLPIPSVNAAYFEVFSLDDLSRTLRILALALAAAALLTTVAGAVIGRWASGRALRPLAQVSRAAETVAGGSLDTRLLAEGDPELSALASSFNRMTDALQERIDHEVRFTADVSHELRSPLTTLATSLGVLESHRDELPPAAATPSTCSAPSSTASSGWSTTCWRSAAWTRVRPSCRSTRSKWASSPARRPRPEAPATSPSTWTRRCRACDCGSTSVASSAS